MFDPKEFFTFSDRLLKASTTEVEWCTVTGRAYYATLMTARTSLFGQTQLTKRIKKQMQQRYQVKFNDRGGSHELILFAAAEQQTVAYQQLNQLKSMRVCADYKLGDEYKTELGAASWEGVANNSVALASQLIPLVARLKPYPVP